MLPNSSKPFPYVVGLITFCSFLPVLGNGFLLWDDKPSIVANPHLMSWTFDNLRWCWTTFHMGPYQPVSWMSLALDQALWPGQAAGFHLTNLLLHCASAVLFYFILQRLTRQPEAAVIGALFFAVHPLRVESVAWVTERRDVLSGVFFMAGWLSYLNRREGSWPAATFVFFLLACLSKVTAVGLIWILWMTDECFLHRRAWKEKIPFLIVAALLVGAGWMGARAQGLFFHPYPLAERAAFAVYSATFYLLKTLAPLRLSPLYSLPLHGSEMLSEFMFRGVLFLLITWRVIRSARQDPLPAWAWFTYLLILLPVSGVAQNGRQIAADRYSYFACLPLVWLLAERLPSSQNARKAAVAGLVVLAALTLRQTLFWRNDRALWERALAVDPANRTALYNLATMDMGKNAGSALSYYERLIKIDPRDADALYNAAIACQGLAEFTKAYAYYQAAIELRPTWIQAMNNLAVVCLPLGKPREALQHLDRALAIDPEFKEARINRQAIARRLRHE